MRIWLFSVLCVLAQWSFAVPQALVRSMEMTGDYNWTREQLVLENTGTTTISGFELRYWFTVDLFKTPVYEIFSKDPALGNLTITLEQVSATLWIAHIFVPSPEVLPGQMHMFGNGIQFGIHNAEWGLWNRDDDPSFKGPVSSMQPNGYIQAYDLNGNLLWGVVPGSSSPSSVTQSSSSISSSIATSSVVQSSSSISASNPVSSSSVSATTCSNIEIYYDGETLLRNAWDPYDWPGTIEEKANISQVAGLAGLSGYFMKTEGEKGMVGDWVSGYVLPGSRDFRGATFALSVVSFPQHAEMANPNWGFRLVDANNLESGTSWHVMPLAGLDLRIPVAEFNAPPGFALDKVAKVLFIVENASANVRLYTYLDNIRLECGQYDVRSTTGGTVVSSSSVATGNLTIAVSGYGSANPSGTVLANSGQNVTVQFTPDAGYKLGSVLFDLVPAATSNGKWSWLADGLSHSLLGTFTPETGSIRTLQINRTPGGRVSMEGTFLVGKDAVYQLLVYPNEGYRVVSVTVDGVNKGAVSKLVLGPFPNMLQTVMVTFAEKEKASVVFKSTGVGKLVLPGNDLVSQTQVGRSFPVGEPVVMGIEEAAGYYLRSLKVNGVSVDFGPQVLVPVVAGNNLVEAVFEAQSQICPAVVQTAHAVPDVFGRPTYQISAPGNSLAAGYYFDYYIQLSMGDQLSIGPWWFDGYNYLNTDLGGGLWRLRFSSPEGLGMGYSRTERKFAIGLQYSNEIPWYKSSEISATDEYDEVLRNNARIPLYRADGERLCGAMPPLRNTGVAPILEVYHSEECSGNYLKPVITIKNTGIVPVSDFSYYYLFHAENGRIPQLDGDWYSPGAQVSLFCIGNDYYAIRYDFSGSTIHPGQSILSKVGVHYEGWALMDMSDDYSWKGGSCGAEVLNPYIPVYDKDGKQISGNTVQIDDPTVFSQGAPTISGPADMSLLEGTAGEFSVQIQYGSSVFVQWVRDGVRIPGANGLSFPISKANLNEDGSTVWVEVRTGDGNVYESRHALLHVFQQGMLPVILEQPKGLFRREGQSAAFSVEAIDPMEGALTYQWTANGVIIAGATQEILNYSSLVVAQNGTVLQVKVTNATGTIKSSAVVLQVKPNTPTSKQVTIVGRLVESQRPAGVSDSLVSMTVRVYTQKNGGPSLYEERFWILNGYGMAVHSSRFALQLGTGETNDDLEQLALLHKTLYAEILVGPSARQEVAGERIPFTAIPYVLPTPRSQP